MSSVPVRRREIFGWACYDFANSSFTTVIITVVYSIYFVESVNGGKPGGYGLWSLVLALSQIVVIATAPWLGAVGDVTARKKTFLALSAWVCSLATASLFWTGPGTLLLACALVFLANIAFSIGENFCASFLPEISTRENVGRISAYGWGFGYCGGLLSLGLALFLIKGTALADPVRWTFAMTGAFFFLASLPTLLLLRERAVPQPGISAAGAARAAWGKLVETFHEIRHHRTLAWFFVSFFFYITGLSAVFAFAAIVARDLYGFTQEEVIILFAALQVTSTLGALGFGWLQDRWGARPVLIASLLGWVVVSFSAGWCTDKTSFWIIGACAGLVMGSTQSASRAVVSSLTPAGRSGEYFGFWGLFGKLAAVVGPLALGQGAEIWSLRTATMVNTVFFIVGLGVFIAIRWKPKAQAA
ncbi:MAG: MFS transporter [Candidatus Methylacidiphilales bacterium]|nr:MFS transporter [Candidatus Methylacidiphilales bacterium]